MAFKSLISCIELIRNGGLGVRKLAKHPFEKPSKLGSTVPIMMHNSILTLELGNWKDDILLLNKGQCIKAQSVYSLTKNML